MFQLFMVLKRKTMKMAMPTITKMIKMITHGFLYQAGSVLRFGVDDGKGDFVRPFSPGVEEEDV